MRYASTLFSVFILLLLGGCAQIPSLQERRQTLASIADQDHLHSQTILTTRFSLVSLSDTSECEDRAMRVYIEGDGFAWATRSRLSSDPTPINPLAAKLMSLDYSHCKVYLARPCQYVTTGECKSDYWSNRRFSSQVIESYDQALDIIKQNYKIDSFVMIGYSGGGAVAALLAAKRNDVKKLITVAGNLDTEAWVAHHNLSPLEGSLNPADSTKDLAKIPQTHWIGGKDTVIPFKIYESYKSKFKHPDKTDSLICAECTHATGWIEKWKQYLINKDHQ